MAFKKMVAAFHDHHLFRLWRRVHNFFQALGRAVLVARSADKKFWLGTVCQVLVNVSAAFHAHRRAQRYQPNHALIVTSDAKARRRAKRKSTEDDRKGKSGFNPVERGADVLLLAMPAIVLAFAHSRAAEVEAQHREPEPAQRLHGV